MISSSCFVLKMPVMNFVNDDACYQSLFLQNTELNSNLQVMEQLDFMPFDKMLCR